MDKQLKDMVQFCPNTQPIYGQIYPTDQRKPAEWYIGRPGTPYQFRFFMADAHVRELLATIPLELRDDQTSMEGLEARIREEVKAEYEEKIAELTKTIEYMSLEMTNDDYDFMEDEQSGSLIDQLSGASDVMLGIEPTVITEKVPVMLPDKPPAPEVFRCLDTGKDFDTLEALQEHQRKLADKATQPAPTTTKKKPTSQERLDQRRGKGPK